MGDDDRSFISLQEKEQDEQSEEDDEDDMDEQDEHREDQPHSVQNTTSEDGSVDEDIVAGSRQGNESVEESVVGMSMHDITVPVSLIVAGNILVILVVALFSQDWLMRMIALGFACVEVLVGAALWYVHSR